MSASDSTGPSSSLAVPVAIAIGSMLFFQAGASVAKLAFPLASAPAVATLRLGFSSLMLLLFWRPWRTQLSSRSLGQIAAYGAALGAMNLTFYASLSRIPLGIAVALEFVGPLGLALMHSKRARDLLWLGVACCGVYWLLPLGAGVGAEDFLGVALALLAGLFWALYIVFGQKAGAQGQGAALAYGSIVATIIVAPFGIAFSGPAMLGQKLLLLGLTVAVLSSAIPYSLEMISMVRMPARTFGVLMSVEPAVGAVAGFALLGEHLSTGQLAGIGLVILASSATVATSTGGTAAKG
jgi:inner membrane transporter RhtA